MRALLVTFLILLAIGYCVATSFVAVDETQYVIIKQFGRPVRIVLEPGLQLKLPWPFQTVVRFDNRLQVFEDPSPDATAKEYLTRDKKNVEVATATFWRIRNEEDAVLRFLETVRDAQGAEIRLADIIKSQFNAMLGSADFEAFVSTDPEKRRWTEMIDEVERACAARARDSFGIEIVDLSIQRLNFPAQNRVSVFERMRSERKRIATQYRSEGDAEAMRIRAEAMAEQERILAEARAEAERIRGRADAEATRIYGEAYGTDPEFYRFLRTLESYEKGLDSDTILILPAEAPFFRLLTRPDVPLEELPVPTPFEMETLSHDGPEDPQSGANPQG